jgi:translation elongation factor P/translation initiation factor 5A
MSSKEESALKNKGLEIIHIKIKGLREGVKKLTTYFATRLKIEPSFERGNCKTIYLEDEFSATRDLITTKKQLNEIKELKRLFSTFIALYRRANKLYYNSDIEILE